MKGLIHKLLSAPFALRRIENKLDDLLILTARNYFRSFDINSPLSSLHDVEYKVFSQWGDDGIIQYLVKKLNIQEKRFIEFGVENYRESNTRFLLINNNWKGLIFDGSSKHIKTIHNDEIYWKYNLKAECAFITRENINELISKNGFGGKVGLLHIDIDGNDYWIWDAINNVEADIVIMEYNAYFGTERAITIPYTASFDAASAHPSRVYFGASLPAFVQLAQQKGYFHIGCNSAGNNAYFLHKKYKGQVPELSTKDGFVMIQSRQTRDSNGQLNFVEEDKVLSLVKNMPVINVLNGQTEHL